MANTHPRTARALLAVVEPFGPAVEGDDLVSEDDPPADLDAVLRVLHTGVRSLLVLKTWFGCDGQTGRVYELNPSAPIPGNITLLAVEGDKRWDRIDPSARLDYPGLFDPVEPSGSSSKRAARSPPRERSGE